MRRLIRSLVSLAVVIGFAIVLAHFNRTVLSSQISDLEIMDGDSLRLDGQEIRLFGIDAPEYRQTCRRQGKDMPCGVEARSALVSFTDVGNITCVGHQTDQYDRLLAVCYDGETDINAEMVRQGFALSYGAYQGHEREAQLNKRGLWSGSFERPEDYRRINKSEAGLKSDLAAGLYARLIHWFSAWLP